MYIHPPLFTLRDSRHVFSGRWREPGFFHLSDTCAPSTSLCLVIAPLPFCLFRSSSPSSRSLSAFSASSLAGLSRFPSSPSSRVPLPRIPPCCLQVCPSVSFPSLLSLRSAFRSAPHWSPRVPVGFCLPSCVSFASVSRCLRLPGVCGSSRVSQFSSPSFFFFTGSR